MVQRRYLQSAAYKSFSLQLTLILLIILGCHGKTVLGTLTLSPMMVAPVCRVGDPLQLTCTASVEFIRWSIVVVNEQGMEEEITVSRNSRDSAPPPRERIINSTTFTFTRTSAEDILPLISTLAINLTSIDLNGTVVRCVDTNNALTPASTTIQIVDTKDLYTLNVKIISEEYEADNVTITVEWTQQVDVTYTARTSPLALSSKTSIRSNSQQVQLILSYNTDYNLSVEATAPCRPNTTDLVRLSYANCGDPEFLLPTSNDSVPIIEPYDGLRKEGNTITFSCPPGFILNGPNSATCVENGEWEPDLAGVMCINTTDTTVPILSGDSVILIGSVSAVIILCIAVTAMLVAVVVYRKGLTEKQSSSTKCIGGGKSSAKHSGSHKVVYQKKSSLWIDNNDQSPQEDLVYADVTVATKNKKMTMIPNKPTVSTTQPELNVEYSAINFKLSNEKPVVEQRQSHDDSLDVTLDKLLVLLRAEVGPRWYDFGEAVGIDDVVLESIAKTAFPENCIVEVLDYWLKYFDDGTLSWRDVATALRDINLHELAYHIEQVYSVEADTTDLLQESVPSMVTPSSQVLPSAPLKKSGIQAHLPVPPPR